MHIIINGCGVLNVFLLNNMLKGQFSSVRLPQGQKLTRIQGQDTNLPNTIQMVHYNDKKTAPASISEPALVL